MSSGSGESRSSSSGGEQSPLAHGGEDPTPQSTVGVATPMGDATPLGDATSGLVGPSGNGDGHHTVPIGDELPRTAEVSPQMVEPSGEGLPEMTPSGDVAATLAGDPNGGGSTTVATSSTLVSDFADDRPEGSDNVAM